MRTGVFRCEEKDDQYLITIKGLRSRNFGNNLPFLILSGKLPEGQVYREYPDGHIEIQKIFASGAQFHYEVVKTLAATEAEKVRKAYGLL